MKKYVLLAVMAIVFLACEETENVEVIAEDFELTLEENPLEGHILGNVVGRSSDNANVTFEMLYQTPEGAMTLNTTSGQLVVADASIFDFEVNNKISATVQVSNGTNSSLAEIRITLQDISTAIVTSDFSTTIDENPSNGTIITNVQGDLMEAGHTTGTGVFSIFSESVPGAFLIDETSGELTVLDSALFNYEINPTLEAVVAIEHNGVSKEANVTVTLNDLVAEPIAFNQVAINETHFSARAMHQAIVFKDKLWVIGGYNYNQLNDVWSSSDGINWTEHTPVGDIFPVRYSHQVVVFKDKLWVIGGWHDGATIDDIWSSPDGINWTKETPIGTHFSSRMAFQSLVFNNKIWVIGGAPPGISYQNDIWSSTDGLNWIEETVIGIHFVGREYFQAVAFNNKLWVVGGYTNGDGRVNDIWTSEDGVNWTEILVTGDQFPKLQLSQLLEFENKLWLIGGSVGSFDYLNDVWTSNDGINWKKEIVAGTPFSKRSAHQALVFNDNIWVIGGFLEDEHQSDEIWTLQQ